MQTRCRPGGMGGDDLYMALRGAKHSPFLAPIHLLTVNSPQNESDPYFHADLGLLIFAKDDEIYWSQDK